jgi:hypothetical protein
VPDFVFVANLSPGWRGESRILERDGDQPAMAVDVDDDQQQTDHRPLEAVFRFDAAPDPDDGIDDDTDVGGAVASRAEILRRLDELERGLRELRALISGR